MKHRFLGSREGCEAGEGKFLKSSLPSRDNNFERCATPAKNRVVAILENWSDR
jgi:hypothetical protein